MTLGRYAGVWRLPGAPVLLVFGLVARLGISMTPLGLLLLVQQATGRYAPAALAGGVYTLCLAAASPVAGRIVDRVGPSPVLLATVVVHPVGLAALLLVAHSTDRGLAWIVAAAAFSGATYPPLVGVLRGAWSGLTEPDDGRGHLRGTALAAETSLYQCVFIVGPLLVAGLVTIGSPYLVIATSAAVTVLGTVPLARGLAMRTWRPRPHTARTHGLGPLRSRGFPAMLACAAGLGLAFGAVTVAVPAYATTHGSGSGALAGVLFAVLSGGSALGGIWFGARRPSAPLPRQFAALLAAVAVSYAVFAMMPHPAALAVALFLGGALVAPTLTVESSLIGQITPAGMRTEAFTWAVTVEVAATAVGIQASGLIVDRPGGVPWAFLPATVAVGLAAVLAALPDGSIVRAYSHATYVLPETIDP